MAHSLLSRKYDVVDEKEVSDENGNSSLLHRAAYFGDTEVLSSLIKDTIDMDLRNGQGDTALLLAVEKGHEAMVSSLIEAGATVDRVNQYRQTPLAVASIRGHVGIARSLLQAGASVNHADGAGDTPLFHACRHAREDVVLELLQSGAMLEIQNNYGDTPLMASAHLNRVDIVRDLIQHGANINRGGFDQNTPLISAVSNHALKACQVLVNLGAEVNAVNRRGMNALMTACRYNDARILKFLAESGSSLTHMTRKQQSALWFAVCQSLSSCSPCLTYLLDAGVKIGSEFHCAVSFGLIHVVKAMLLRGAVPKTVHVPRLNFLSPPPVSFVSPLCVALVTQRTEIAIFLMNIGFLTRYDIYLLPKDLGLRQHLEEHSKSESLILLDTLMYKPWSLYTLSLLVVSKIVGYDFTTRQVRVSSSGLPPLIQRMLLYE